MLQRGLRRGNHASGCFVSKCVHVVLLVDTSTTRNWKISYCVTLQTLDRLLQEWFFYCSPVIELRCSRYSSWSLDLKLQKTWKDMIYIHASVMPRRICNVYCVHFFGGESTCFVKVCFVLLWSIYTVFRRPNTTIPLLFFFVFFSSTIHIHIGTGTLNTQCWTVEDLGSNSTWARFILPERSGSKLGLLYGTPDHLGWWDVSSWWIRVCWIVDTVRTFLRSNLDNQLTTFRRHQQNPGTLMQFKNEPRNLFSEADYFAAGYYDVITFRRLLGWLRRSCS